MRRSRHTQEPVERRPRVEHQREGSAAIELRVPARRSELAAARASAHQAATAFGLGADASYEFVFAVNEAVTNAIKHGTPDEQGMICVRFSSDADRLTCAVHDRGTFLVPTAGREQRSENGRGLSLMARLVDDLRLSIKPGHTVVRLSKDRPRAGINPVPDHAGAAA
jgi:anti-sigma regulatory factor (Ser/Thr protein kinase)